MMRIIQKMKEKLKKRMNQKGQGMVEYAIIIAVVAVIAIVVLGNKDSQATDKTLAGSIRKAFETASAQIDKAATDTTATTPTTP